MFLLWCLDCYTDNLNWLEVLEKPISYESVKIIPSFCLSRKWTILSYQQGEARPWLGHWRVSSGPRKIIRGISYGRRKLSCGGCRGSSRGPVVSGEGVWEWKSWWCQSYLSFQPGEYKQGVLLGFIKFLYSHRYLSGNKNPCPHKVLCSNAPSSFICHSPKWKIALKLKTIQMSINRWQVKCYLPIKRMHIAMWKISKSFAEWDKLSPHQYKEYTLYHSIHIQYKTLENGMGQREGWIAMGHKNFGGWWKCLVNCIGFTEMFICPNVSHYVVSGGGEGASWPSAREDKTWWHLARWESAPYDYKLTNFKRGIWKGCSKQIFERDQGICSVKHLGSVKWL